MNRLLKLENELLKYIEQQEGKLEYRDESLEWEKIHMSSSASIAYRLAMSRGEDSEIAACAAAIHDFGRIITGKQRNHANDGYLPSIEFLKSTNLFIDKEIEIMSLAVKNHSNKTEVGTPIEEIVKDADVIDCYHYGYAFDRPEKEERYLNWLKSLEK